MFAGSAKNFEDALATAHSSRAAYYLAAAAYKQACYRPVVAKLASELGEAFDIYGPLPVAAVESRTPPAPPLPAPPPVRKFAPLGPPQPEPEMDLRTAKKKARQFYGPSGYAVRSRFYSKNWGSHSIGFTADGGEHYTVCNGYSFHEVFAKAPRSKVAFFLTRAQKSQADFLASLAFLEREIGRKVDPHQDLKTLTVDALFIAPVAA